MKDAYYFSHDSNARSDPKIMAMMSEYKSEGYGWFWIIIEMLSEQKGYKLKLSKWLFTAIAMVAQSDIGIIEKFIHSCINDFELLRTDGEYFWSESLIRRMEIKEVKRKKKSLAGKKGAEKRWPNITDEIQGDQTDSSAIAKDSSAIAKDSSAITTDSKGKESKANESKEKKINYKQYVSMTEKEYSNLIQEYGETRVEDKIDDLNNWKGSKGKQTESDYLTIRAWMKKEHKGKLPEVNVRNQSEKTIEDIFGKEEDG